MFDQDFLAKFSLESKKYMVKKTFFEELSLQI
ncbi:hypothetical protein OPIT5_13775 [Opitutaceae bacterium TAV5]|nr:hypothetical protein OPIT5_13775 [Opitutaceae bacterium TAV5]